MSLGFDPISALSLPDGTNAEERDLVTTSDVLVGGQSRIEFGIRGRNVLAGERVQFGGDIEAAEDCRLDMWSTVGGNVLVGKDAYLGERVSIDGRLMVSGDLDIGDDVQIADGFEANGWIVIRNPMPTIVFLFIYLTQLLRVGEETAAEELLEEVMGTEEQEDAPLTIPRGAEVSDDRWQVSTPARIGRECRLHGNLRASEIEIGEQTELFGSLRARRTISIAAGARIHGDVTTRGDVIIGNEVEILGDVACRNVELGENAVIEGEIRASGSVTLSGEDESD